MLFMTSIPLFPQEDQTSEIKVIDYDVTLLIWRSIRELEALERVALGKCRVKRAVRIIVLAKSRTASSPLLSVSQLAVGKLLREATPPVARNL
jgi:hypothetical protein